jgi:hypothetical protein
MFDSDVRVAGAILEYIRTNKKDMLEKEKELLTEIQLKIKTMATYCLLN